MVPNYHLNQLVERAIWTLPYRQQHLDSGASVADFSFLLLLLRSKMRGQSLLYCLEPQAESHKEDENARKVFVEQ